MFSALSARLTNTPTTSVAIGKLDTNASLDIAATSDAGNGEVVIFQNGGSGTFSASTTSVGENPRALHLADMNGDGKLDLVVANDILGGGISVVMNTTQPAASGPDTIAFAAPIAYPVTGSQPSTIALADTNQDGLPDVAIGYATNEYVSLVVGQQQGVLKEPTDRNWAMWLYNALLGRSPSLAERGAVETTLINGYLAFLNVVGTNGVTLGAAAPLSITPTDNTDLSYTVTFAPQLVDGTYALWIGPNAQGVNLKDFVDKNGTFVNTGNAMNQNQNATNGENPGDRLRTRFAVSTSDDGRYISALYGDLQGLAPSGRAPDSEGFISASNTIEPARLAALTTTATGFVTGTEGTNALITGLYQRFLRRAPNTTELSTARGQLLAGQITVRNLVVQILAGTPYFTEAQVGVNGNNAAWLEQIYQDVLHVSATTGDATHTSDLAGLNASTLTRTTVANALVFSDAAIKQAVSEYFLQYLGRGPVRNSYAPNLDETFNFNGTNFTNLLKQAAVPGTISPDQQLIIALLATPEYLRLVGNSNSAWLQSVYLKVLGRSTIDTTSAEFTTALNTLLTNAGYIAARQSVATSLVGTVEFHDRLYTNYYNQFLGRTPTTAELTSQENFFQTTANRTYEGVIANILRTNEYFPLSGPGSLNSTWLDNIYEALLGRSTANDSTAANQLTYLNSQSPPNTGMTTTTLSNARYTVALQVLNSAEYHGILVQQLYNTYLGRNPTTTELNNWVSQLNAGTVHQQNIVYLLLKDPEYFLLKT
jgi:hypothetical protein